MHNFTPLAGLAGGALIGLASALLMLLTGRIAGISGIFGGLLPLTAGDRDWRLAFIAGMIAAPLIAALLFGAALPHPALPSSLAVVAIGGVLVGFGSRMGAGCTSGHGVCGVARLSARSLAATAIFMVVAIATVADVVPLTGENRVIVQRGLSGLRRVRNQGMRALMAVAGFGEGECPSAHQVAFRLAPRINAAGRMATACDVIELFMTEDGDRARALAEQLDRLNRERQQTESEIVEEILRQCESAPVPEDFAGLVFTGENWHPDFRSPLTEPAARNAATPHQATAASSTAGCVRSPRCSTYSWPLSPPKRRSDQKHPWTPSNTRASGRNY